MTLNDRSDFFFYKHMSTSFDLQKILVHLAFNLDFKIGLSWAPVATVSSITRRLEWIAAQFLWHATGNCYTQAMFISMPTFEDDVYSMSILLVCSSSHPDETQTASDTIYVYVPTDELVRSVLP